jgi:DsbC/DsbD-like thiol-disulfide interchange protein
MAFVLAMIFGTLGAFFAASSCRADSASPWDADIRSALRLIAGSGAKSGSAALLRAGIEMRLDPGWKTYWRYPGDSGVPPVFDFTGSENVKSVTLLWPAPQRFPDGAGGNSIGYTGHVVFPVHVMAQEVGKPVTLRVKADYAVCEKLCVPAEGKAELKLAFISVAGDAALADAEARVPKPKALGEAGFMSIGTVHREVTGGKPRVIVDLVAPDGARVDLFAEGPTPKWALPLPEPVTEGPAGVRRFAFAIDGVPPGEKVEGALLKLTLVANDEAIEVAASLD